MHRLTLVSFTLVPFKNSCPLHQAAPKSPGAKATTSRSGSAGHWGRVPGVGLCGRLAKRVGAHRLTGWWFGTCFMFYIGNNHPNWLSYFSEGLKPPTILACPLGAAERSPRGCRKWNTASTSTCTAWYNNLQAEDMHPLMGGLFVSIFV